MEIVDTVQLIVKVQQFEDKRIAAKASWNIRQLKGKLSEIYPTSTEEQKLIYSGKLLNDTTVLKDVLKEYEGLEAHTVHLVFTPKNLPPLNRAYSSSKDQQKSSTSPATSTSSSDMSGNELRQRHTTATASSSSNNNNGTAQQTTNIPNNYYNAFYASGMDANNILAQQYAMQTWMQQAYAQYINQYMNIMSSPEAFQQQQQAQSMSNLGFLPPQMPLISSQSSTPSAEAVSPQPPAEPINQDVPQPPQPQQPAVDAQQRRFPNIIQDEQENRDWLDILYSMSRLLILMCLVYFYSSPLRCCIVILIGVSIYLYHIYRQNQNRLNNNNTTRVNLNNVNNRPAQQPPQDGAEVPSQQPTENAENNEESQQQVESELATQIIEPQVPVLEVVKTFLVSFVASIIPTDPAI